MATGYSELKAKLTTPGAKEVYGSQATLRLGDPVPDFEADTTIGKIKFHEWLGSSWGILFSHPRDFTPVCTTEIGKMAELQAEWDKRDTKVTVLSVDTVEHHQGWIKDVEDVSPPGTKVKFPLIADPDRKLSVLYGMLDQSEIDKEGLPLTVRSVFFIDPKKLVRTKLDYPASTGRNFDEILRILDSLQTVSYHQCATPVNWRRGGEVVVHPSLSDDKAKEVFPKGFKKLTNYLRLTADPIQGKDSKENKDDARTYIIKHKDQSTKLKLRAGNRTEDIHASLATRFNLSSKFVLVDDEGHDVILDHSLPAGTYRIDA